MNLVALALQARNIQPFLGFFLGKESRTDGQVEVRAIFELDLLDGLKKGHDPAEVWGLPLNTSNIHRWYAISKDLARFARFLGAAQPDALLIMPARAPVFTELSCHAAMVDTPHQCAVLHDLLDGWCAHKKAGAYTGCLAHNMHNKPERAPFGAGAGGCESCRREQS